jgi:hypothetical protein
VLTDLYQFVAEPLIIAELGDFLFRFAHGCRSGQRFGDGLSMPFLGEAHDGAVARVVGARTMAVRLSAPEHGADDGTRAHVFEIVQSAEQFGSARLQAGKGLRHGPPYLPKTSNIHVAHPPDFASGQ